MPSHHTESLWGVFGTEQVEEGFCTHFYGGDRGEQTEIAERKSHQCDTNEQMCKDLGSLSHLPGAHCNESWLGIFGKHTVQEFFIFR